MVYLFKKFNSLETQHTQLNLPFVFYQIQITQLNPAYIFLDLKFHFYIFPFYCIYRNPEKLAKTHLCSNPAKPRS